MDKTNQTSCVKSMIDSLLTDNSGSEHATENDTGNNPMTTIQLSGECTIYEIMQLHQQIHDNWSDNTGLELELSGVTEVDAAFIQLLASCKNTAENNHQRFQLKNPSESLNDKITAMFVQDFFFKDDDSEHIDSTSKDSENPSSDKTTDA